MATMWSPATDHRSIIHMDLDSFFVSVERLQNDYFVGKPLLIGGGSDRGVVASCSYEARAFGVHSAMPMRLAKQLCPEAIVVRGDMERYSQYSQMVTEIVHEAVPSYEKSSIDEFYVDLTGMEKFFGCMKLATELKARIRKETGLPISFGLSENKTVSKVATNESKPDGQRQIAYGTEKGFLSPLTVDKIPMVGEKTAYTLRKMGVQKIHTLQQVPVEMLAAVFGKMGIVISEKANGIDRTPIVPYSERKSISTENTFGQDTIDVKKLESILVAMTEQLAFKLRKEQQLTSCVTVKIRYSDFDTHTLQRKMPYTSADHVLIPMVKELFKKAYSRRMLIRLIGVRFSSLVHGNYQINLFEDTEEGIKLYQAMDKLRQKHGDKAVVRAVGMGVSRRSFNPFNGVAA
ncbi:MAG: DNA polymerase IV [Imperialibacter sp.]